MRLKRHFLSVAGIATLRQIVEDYELTVEDKRKRQALEDTISVARPCKPDELLCYLSEQEVKQVCEAAGVDARGRKNALIERLLPPPTTPYTEGRALIPACHVLSEIVTEENNHD